MTEGKTARGASSPAKPALTMPEPLSHTRAATSSSAMLKVKCLEICGGRRGKTCEHKGAEQGERRRRARVRVRSNLSERSRLKSQICPLFFPGRRRRPRPLPALGASAPPRPRRLGRLTHPERRGARATALVLLSAKRSGSRWSVSAFTISSALTLSKSHQSTLPRVELGTEDQGVSIVERHLDLPPSGSPRCHHGTQGWPRSGMSPPAGALRGLFPFTGGASPSYTSWPSRRAG